MAHKRRNLSVNRDVYGVLIRLILLSQWEMLDEYPGINTNMSGGNQALLNRRSFETRMNWKDMSMEDRIDYWFGSVWKGFK